MYKIKTTNYGVAQIYNNAELKLAQYILINIHLAALLQK